MRIAMVTDTYLPEVNGVTTVLSVMRRGLLDRGHDVRVLAPRYPVPGPDDTGVVRRASMPFPGYEQVRLSLPIGFDVGAELDRFAPDVVHVITEGPLGGIGRRWALRRRVPLVTSFHTDFPRYAQRYLGAWAVPIARSYLRWFHGPARTTQTPSATTRDELVEHGIPHAVVWGRGVDAVLFTPARRSEARRAERGAAGKAMILHVGRLAVEKDIETLIASFQMAAARAGDRAMFCVAGDGPKAAEARTALPDALHLGFLPRPVLADLYADADLFVFPSPTETCGLVALEAMASGLPVVSSDSGGVLENMRPGLNGTMVRASDPAAFADAIMALIDDPGQRLAMAQGARAFAVARDWASELDQLVPQYGALTVKPPVAPAPSSATPALADG